MSKCKVSIFVQYIIDFVGTSLFLRFALQVAMATKHFHKVQNMCIFRIFFSHLAGPKTLYGTRKKLP